MPQLLEGCHGLHHLASGWDVLTAIHQLGLLPLWKPDPKSPFCVLHLYLQ